MVEYKEGESLSVISSSSVLASGRGRSEVFRRLAKAKGFAVDVEDALKAEKVWHRNLRRFGARRALRMASR